MPQKIIDLTILVHEGMQTFPTYWHTFVEITQLGRHGIENRETRKIVMGTHTGTHVDAHRHFIPNGETIDRIAPDVFIGPAAVVDLTAVPKGKEIGADELADRIPKGRHERLILRFDWSKQLGSRSYYSDHAFLSEAAAQWIVDQKYRLIAMDTPMPDDPKNGFGCTKDSPNHKILLGQGVILVEYLTNLQALSLPVVDLVVAPIKIEGGDGAPARVFAIER